MRKAGTDVVGVEVGDVVVDVHRAHLDVEASEVVRKGVGDLHEAAVAERVWNIQWDIPIRVELAASFCEARLAACLVEMVEDLHAEPLEGPFCDLDGEVLLEAAWLVVPRKETVVKFS